MEYLKRLIRILNRQGINILDNSIFTDYSKINYCPICFAKNIFLKYPEDVYKCESCNFLFRNPRPTNLQIEKSYRSGHIFRRWDKESDKRKKLWEKRYGIVRKFIKEGNLLDIGTGNGDFLKFANNNFTAVGTEINTYSTENYSEHNIILSRIENFKFSENYFDVVTMWHVIEHLPNPSECLDIIKKILKPEGIFIIALPNELFPLFKSKLKSLYKKNFTYSPFEKLLFGEEIHLNHFTPKTIDYLLQRKNFLIELIGVDNVYVDANIRSYLNLLFSKLTFRILGKYHFEKAMYIVCRNN